MSWTSSTGSATDDTLIDDLMDIAHIAGNSRFAEGAVWDLAGRAGGG